MYGVLKSCKFVIVICEYNGDVVDVYGVLKSCGSVKSDSRRILGIGTDWEA